MRTCERKGSQKNTVDTCLASNKARILVIGDGAAKTGFGRVVESILRRIADRYSISQIAINYRGDPYPCAWDMYPAQVGSDQLGVSRVRELVQKTEPDLIFSVNDFWVQGQYLDELARAESRVPVVLYSPVDATPLEGEWLRRIPGVAACVVYTEPARHAVLEALGAGISDINERIHVIPHGVDADTFYPIGGGDMASRTEAKLELGVIESSGEESFVVLNANRNQPRKRIDLTLRGFEIFARGKPPGVRLFLHCGRRDQGWDIDKMARRLGIERRLILSGPAHGGTPSVSDEKLNLVYNACDVGINTSGGEGWGLPSFEHAATRRAQIVPRHASCEEIWDGAAEMLEVPIVAAQPSTLSDFHYTTAEMVAETLEKLYGSPDYRDEVANRCYEVATREDYHWDRIAAAFEKLFESVLATEQKKPVQ